MKALPTKAKASPRLRTWCPTPLDLSPLDVLGKALAVKGPSVKRSGVMKRNLFKKPSSLVVGAYPRERQRVTQSLTVPFHSVRENPGGAGNGPVSCPIVTSPQAHSLPSSSKVLGMEQGDSGCANGVDPKLRESCIK